jgi:hypothetical protein
LSNPFGPDEDGDLKRETSLAALLEFAATVWHFTPDYILDNWTDDQLILYIAKHNERRYREENPEDDRIDYAASGRQRYLAFQKSQQHGS